MSYPARAEGVGKYGYIVGHLFSCYLVAPLLFFPKQFVAYNRAVGLTSRVFVNGPGDRGSIPRRVIPKIQKMVLDAALINTQNDKVRIKGEV